MTFNYALVLCNLAAVLVGIVDVMGTDTQLIDAKNITDLWTNHTMECTDICTDCMCYTAVDTHGARDDYLPNSPIQYAAIILPLVSSFILAMLHKFEPHVR